MAPDSNDMASKLGSVIIEPVGGYGGANHYDLALCCALREAGVDATLATSDLTDAPPGMNVRVLQCFRGIFGKDPSWRRLARFARGTLTAMRDARQRRADIVHLHWYGFGPTQAFNAWLARLRGFKLVITAHDVEGFVGRGTAGWAARRSYGAAHAVIAHNQVSRDELLQKMQLPASRVHVIRHGDHAELADAARSRDAARVTLGLATDEFVVGFFGQIKEVKGLDVLIRAAAKARTGTQRRLRLLIAGRPWRQDFSAYDALIDELGLRDQVSLHIRYIDDADLPDFYCACDVMVLPYRRIYQSGVILMAVALRRPVIVSDIPGMTEMITDGSNGLVFKSGDADDLAARLVWAESHGTALAGMADTAFDRVRREHDWTQIGQLTRALYAKVATGG